MDNPEKAHLKNRILQFLYDQGSTWSVDAIYNKMDKPTESENHLLEILHEMTKEASRYFDFDPEEPPTYFAANDFTKRFLEEGAFVTEYEKHLKANKAMWNAALRGSRVEELTEKELKQKIRNNRYSLPLSIISIMVALGALIWSVYGSPNNVPQEHYNAKMESIDKELQKLRIDFKQENEELKDRLYKAEMLIAIYEEEMPQSSKSSTAIR